MKKTGFKKTISAQLILSTALAALSLFLLGLGACTKNNPVSQSTSPENGKSSLAGKVLPKNCAAKIILEQGRPIDSARIAADDGYFLLDNLKKGTYRVKIVSTGYDTFSTLISVDENCSYEFGNVLLVEKNKDFNDTIPSVYDHYPQKNDEVIYLPPDKYSQGSQRLFVSVSFDRPMDRASVEKSLSITPPVNGGYFVWYQNTKKFNYQAETTAYSWDGSALYESKSSNVRMAGAMDIASLPSTTPSAEISSYSVAKSFTFYLPRSACFTDTTYTIRISRGAVDTAGTPLDTALTFSFKTVQSSMTYEDIEMVPHDGDDWVPLINSGISLIFPKRMNQKSVESGLTVNLKAKPVFLWQDYNHLTVYTGGIFVPDTTYAITISTSVKDVENNPICTAATQMRFKTAPISVTSSDPVSGKIGVPTGSSILFTFNTYIDRSTIASFGALVSTDGDTLAGTYNYSYYTAWSAYRSGYDTTYILNQIRFVPYVSMDKNTLYTYFLNPGVKDLNGNAMKTDYELSFITLP